jgi:iron(III) transport system permease protein
MMIYASLLPFYPAPSRAAFESMSLANYTSLLSASNTITPMTNFWIIGVFTATIVSLSERTALKFSVAAKARYPVATDNVR